MWLVVYFNAQPPPPTVFGSEVWHSNHWVTSPSRSTFWYIYSRRSLLRQIWQSTSCLKHACIILLTNQILCLVCGVCQRKSVCVCAFIYVWLWVCVCKLVHVKLVQVCKTGVLWFCCRRDILEKVESFNSHYEGKVHHQMIVDQVTCIFWHWLHTHTHTG